jgi:Ethanolamine utilization protein EutJ (predicted chaperonin)
MSKVQGAGAVVMVGFGHAVWRDLFDQDTQPLWGVFDWAPGGRDGQLVVIGAIAAVGLVVTLVASLPRALRLRYNWLLDGAAN